MKTKTKKFKIGEIVGGTFGPMQIIEDTLPRPGEFVFKKQKNTNRAIQNKPDLVEFHLKKE